MIAYIRGIMTSAEEDGVVLETGGIGFSIHTTGRDRDQLIREGKEEVLLHTHLQVREDERVLFGFLSKTDLRNFRKLISVNGVGPKAALSILNLMTAEELYLAVQSGDAKSIAKANNIGPKLAQRVVLELKDSLETESIPAVFAEDLSVETPGNALMDAVEALEALGYSRTEALRAVRSIEGREQLSTEELLSAALRRL
ncbi:MAG: Holliday junction branch migration protein RuvA [Eubacterium sp.]|nr:Holliday junction branch migration protein RuvA [Eubacterium sp.]